MTDHKGEYSAIPTYNAMFPYIWDPEIDSAIIEVVETALPYLQDIVGGELPSDLQGLLGCWSWMDGKNSQICLLMNHLKHEEGYYLAHEVGHLLHYSIRPDLFEGNWVERDIRQTNLTEMIAHGAGLSFADYAPKIIDSVNRVESIYKEKGLDTEFLLDPYYFSDQKNDLMEKTHAGGEKAAEWLYYSCGVKNFAYFAEMDVAEAEKELKRFFGYLRGLIY